MESPNPCFGIAIILSGPSGVGKSTVCHRVFEQMPQAGFSISCTTRQPRVGEKDGVDYYFLTKDAFFQHRDKDDFLEYAEVHGNFYGTLRSQVEPLVFQNKNVVLDIDVQGARKVWQNVKGTALEPHCVSVFLGPPSLVELERRLRGRKTDAEDVIERRLAKASEEMSAWRSYDYVLVNKDVEGTAQQLMAILISEVLKTSRCHDAPWK
ncbi:MAG: guanylate kinase [Lentisphaeria bacterium]